MRLFRLPETPEKGAQGPVCGTRHAALRALLALLRYTSGLSKHGSGLHCHSSGALVIAQGKQQDTRVTGQK